MSLDVVGELVFGLKSHKPKIENSINFNKTEPKIPALWIRQQDLSRRYPNLHVSGIYTKFVTDRPEPPDFDLGGNLVYAVTTPKGQILPSKSDESTGGWGFLTIHPSPPMKEWEFDFGEVTLAKDAKFEIAPLIDRGTSILITTAVKQGTYQADTTLEMLISVFREYGFPARFRLDRDSRLIGSVGTVSILN